MPQRGGKGLVSCDGAEDELEVMECRGFQDGKGQEEKGLVWHLALGTLGTRTWPLWEDYVSDSKAVFRVGDTQ